MQSLIQIKDPLVLYPKFSTIDTNKYDKYETASSYPSTAGTDNEGYYDDDQYQDPGSSKKLVRNGSSQSMDQGYLSDFSTCTSKQSIPRTQELLKGISAIKEEAYEPSAWSLPGFIPNGVL